MRSQSNAPRLPTTDHFMHHPAYGHLLQGRRLTDEAVKSVLTVDYETNHHPARRPPTSAKKANVPYPLSLIPYPLSPIPYLFGEKEKSPFSRRGIFVFYFTSWMMVRIMGRRLVRSKKYFPRASLTWVLMAFHSETLPASQRERTFSMRSLASVRRASLSLT